MQHTLRLYLPALRSRRMSPRPPRRARPLKVSECPIRTFNPSEKIQYNKFRDETSVSAPGGLVVIFPLRVVFRCWQFFVPGLSWCPFCVAVVGRCLWSVAVGVCCAAVSAWLSLCALLLSRVFLRFGRIDVSEILARHISMEGVG